MVVYFVQAEASASIKIGRATEVHKRFAVLQSCSPVLLTLLGWLEGVDDKDLERRLHEQFGHLRQRGEWFAAEPELLDYLSRIKVPAEPPLFPVALTWCKVCGEDVETIVQGRCIDCWFCFGCGTDLEPGREMLCDECGDEMVADLAAHPAQS